MVATVHSSVVEGIHAIPVRVEIDVSSGLPTFEIVGLPGTAVREARDRVRSALRHAGFSFPLGRITVNLAPAHLKKSGTVFDLPIALGILMASGVVSNSSPSPPWLLVGELSLDGSVRPIRGALCIAQTALALGKALVIPSANRQEVEAIPGLWVHPVRDLAELLQKWEEGSSPELAQGASTPVWRGSDEQSWDDIRGQDVAKRALEIAAAGGHHALLAGPPGAGKTALAKRVPHIAPPLSAAEMVEVSAIYSAAGLLDEDRPLVQRRPFRQPHSSATPAAMLGGGRSPQPGEVSLAHKGFLFLDEFPEYSRATLEGLRGPMDDGVVTVARTGGKHAFPAEFTLIATANPCPCGYYGDRQRACICHSGHLARYRRRLAGPLMDRMDVFVYVSRPEPTQVLSGVQGRQESLPLGAGSPRDRVAKALEAQRKRYGSDRRRNRDLQSNEFPQHVALDAAGRRLLRQAAEGWQLSPRALHRVLRVARTIADLDGEEAVASDHVAEALSFRQEACFPPH